MIAYPANTLVAASSVPRKRPALTGHTFGDMTGRNGDSPYLDLDHHAWRGLRASTPMSLTAEQLDEVRGLTDPIQLSEVEDIYLPLSRLLRLYFEASAGLRETVEAFLGEEIRPAPFIIAVAGSVAVGKSTTARLLRTLISQWPQHPHTELVTTDNFLYPNAVLEQRGLADRKGFPESYDRRALLRFVQQVRAGVPEVTAPVYSHLAYDIVPGQQQSVRRPDVLILEGINVLQPAPAGALALADFFDFSVYVDARPEHIRSWFLGRLHALRETAFADPQSPFRRLTQVSSAEVDAFGTHVWKTINEVNLIQNIQPTRARATLVLHKGADHSVTRIRLRRF
jgi:type I pantothenate kinase